MVLSTDQSKVIAKDGNKILVEKKSSTDPRDYKIKLLQENANFVIKFGKKQLCYITKTKRLVLCDKQKTKGTWELVKKDITYYLRQNGRCAALVNSLENPSDSSHLTLKPCTNEDVLQIYFMNSDEEILDLDTYSHAVEGGQHFESSEEDPIFEEVLGDSHPKKSVELEINRKENGKPIKRITRIEKDMSLPVTNKDIRQERKIEETNPKMAAQSMGPMENTSEILLTEKIVDAKPLQPENINENSYLRPNDATNGNMIIERVQKPVITNNRSSTGSETPVRNDSILLESKNALKHKQVQIPIDETHVLLKRTNPEKKVALIQKKAMKAENIQNTSEDEKHAGEDQNDYFSKKKNDFVESLDRDLANLSQETPSSNVKTPGQGTHVQNQNCFIDEKGSIHCHG